MLGPVHQVLHRQPLCHVVLGGHVVAARGLTERAVFIPALVVAWDQLVEHAVPVGLEVAGWVCLQHVD